MNEKTKQFLRSKFQDYYRTADIHLPPEFTSREWGFILFDEMPETVMRRHKGFGSRGELMDYLAGMVPAHAYYSVAYYEYPDAPKMKEKNWLNADLIFDLDADHLPGAPISYADMLEHVKQESLKLLDFLLHDFGFSEKDIHVVFSGGRGYHFHITDPRVLSLGSAERREIVDYISSRGFELDRVFGKKEVSGDAGLESAEVFVFPAGDEGGWGGRINRYIISYLSDIAEQDDAIKTFMAFDGIGKKKAELLVNVFTDEHQISRLKKGNMGALSNIPKPFLKNLAEQAVTELSASVDEPVTGDIKRLIRLPGSLHGGSGMKVTSLSISQLATFQPLNDAVVFGDKAVPLKVIKPFGVQMKGNEFTVDEGTQELPEYAAVYMMCRGAAEHG
jgi:DNA primase small subunit